MRFIVGLFCLWPALVQAEVADNPEAIRRFKQLACSSSWLAAERQLQNGFRLRCLAADNVVALYRASNQTMRDCLHLLENSEARRLYCGNYDADFNRQLTAFNEGARVAEAILKRWQEIADPR